MDSHLVEPFSVECEGFQSLCNKWFEHPDHTRVFGQLHLRPGAGVDKPLDYITCEDCKLVYLVENM